MASKIDDTKPVTGIDQPSQVLRNNFLAAKTEIEILQGDISNIENRIDLLFNNNPTILDDLKDVKSTMPAEDQVLSFNGTCWVPFNPALLLYLEDEGSFVGNFDILNFEGGAVDVEPDGIIAGQSNITFDSSIIVKSDNFILNPDFKIRTRGTKFNPNTSPNNDDGNYTYPKWVLLTESSSGNGPTLRTIKSPYSNLNPHNSTEPYDMVTMTSVTPNEKFGLFQIIDHESSKPTSGLSMVLQFKIKGDEAVDWKIAIVEASTSVVNPVKDPVSAWNANGVNPTLDADWSYVAVSTAVTASGTITQHTLTGITPSSDINYLGVLVWTDSAPTAVGSNFKLGNFRLEIGSTVTDYTNYSFGVDSYLCQQHVWAPLTDNSYFDYSPSDNGVLRIGPFPLGAGQAISATQADIFIQFPAEMRKHPQLSFASDLFQVNPSDFRVTNPSTGALVTVTALTMSDGNPNPSLPIPISSQMGAVIRVTVGSSIFTAGNATILWIRKGANIVFDAELGV